jgi:gingipain R
VDYFLLIGDDIHIPPLREYDYYYADPRYVLIYPDDEDPYPDAFISRISALSIEGIRNQIDKILYYERLPSQTISLDWMKKALVMASQEGYYYPDSVYKNHMKDMLRIKYELVDKLYDYAANPDNIKQKLEDGRGFVNFVGHGSWDRWSFNRPYVNPIFHIDDINALQNPSLPPFIISVACDVGNFSHSSCFAEAWLQQPQLSGAVGFWGSSAPQYWHPPIWADSIAIQSFTHDWFIGDYFPNTFGQILYAGGIGMLRICPADSGPFTFNTWHIFGDASMQVRFGQQSPLFVNHPPIAEPGGIFWVKVLTHYEGRHIYPPCPNTVVSLWKENDNYQDRKLTDQAGYAEFILPRNLTTGPMYVTASKYNKIPYEGTAMIAEIPDTIASPQAQAGEVEVINNYLNLLILPSISGKTFKIKIPFYAASIDIYNRAGKLVKKENADKREFIWQGTDGDGKPLPQGVYFAKANGKEKTEIKKLLLIR